MSGFLPERRAKNEGEYQCGNHISDFQFLMPSISMRRAKCLGKLASRGSVASDRRRSRSGDACASLAWGSYFP